MSHIAQGVCSVINEIPVPCWDRSLKMILLKAFWIDNVIEVFWLGNVKSEVGDDKVVPYLRIALFQVKDNPCAHPIKPAHAAI